MQDAEKTLENPFAKKDIFPLACEKESYYKYLMEKLCTLSVAPVEIAPGVVRWQSTLTENGIPVALYTSPKCHTKQRARENAMKYAHKWRWSVVYSD